MKELKFRAWDKLAKKYVYPDKGYQGHYMLTLNGEFYNLQNGSGGDEYDVQPWTGVKDKDGKDIYEGDILVYEEDKDCTGEIDEVILVCQYQRYNAWFGFYEPKETAEDVYSGYYWLELADKCKVIGNIYENPRLTLGFKS